MSVVENFINDTKNENENKEQKHVNDIVEQNASGE